MKKLKWREWIIDRYCNLPRTWRKPLWRFWHRVINRVDEDRKNVFLNYGFADGGDSGNHSQSAADDPGARLYDRVAAGCILPEARILEVGCGRGGGAAWLTRTYQPKEYIGLDISRKVIAFCRSEHRIPQLAFVQGEAEDLPFAPDSFDGLINVESSRCYGSLDQFFGEVGRVLKPGGRFCYADMMEPTDVPVIRSGLLRQKLHILEEEDMTPGVVRALQGDSGNRRAMIDQYAPAFMRPAFYEFAGVEGSRRFEIFQTGEMAYRRFVLTNNKS